MFDQQVAEANSKRTPTSDFVVEIHRYLQYKNIDRKEDPLLWWKLNSTQFLKLKYLALKYLCIPGTSVLLKGYSPKLGN